MEKKMASPKAAITRAIERTGSPKTKCLWAIVIMMLGTMAARSQEITDIAFGVGNKELTLYYSLSRRSDVRVRVSVDQGRSFSEPLQNLSGDVGKNVAPGKARKIIAYDLQEIRGIDTSQIVFKVEVDDGSVEVAVFDTILFRMLPVLGGTFRMGCTQKVPDKYKYDAEYPVHEVTVSSFYMAEYEVTQKLWVAVMGDNPSRWTGNDSLPVEQVSWNNAQLFIARLSQLTGRHFRLPTEAEWEFAARGGIDDEDGAWPGENGKIDDYAWYCLNSKSVTHPVGQKRPNELGLYDMAGNVSEWCSDWMESYTKDKQSDPRGPKNGENRIMRGGSINSPSYGCTVSDRSWYLPDHGYGYHGFRLVMDL